MTSLLCHTSALTTPNFNTNSDSSFFPQVLPEFCLQSADISRLHTFSSEQSSKCDALPVQLPSNESKPVSSIFFSDICASSPKHRTLKENAVSPEDWFNDFPSDFIEISSPVIDASQNDCAFCKPPTSHKLPDLTGTLKSFSDPQKDHEHGISTPSLPVATEFDIKDCLDVLKLWQDDYLAEDGPSFSRESTIHLAATNLGEEIAFHTNHSNQFAGDTSEGEDSLYGNFTKSQELYTYPSSCEKTNVSTHDISKETHYIPISLPSSESADSCIDIGELSTEARRRVKNNASSRRSRAAKKQRFARMYTEAENLKKRNTSLKKTLSALETVLAEAKLLLLESASKSPKNPKAMEACVTRSSESPFPST